ncbi:serine/arginine repetitive matrix protein 2-like [Macaca thibetana thibetana]|uniref:serine/arginine repetitive matrix protein 2-like n=1 Tax=Macaca thibetana thibetana TaxID=257877 RepID=UPI0000D9B19B|nr:serine/arginine repetitive matrix protein 2-like [Macaca thibetana thibetana]
MSRLSLLGGQGGSHPRVGRTGARRRSARRRRGRSTTPLGGNRGREHARPPYVSKDWREISAQGGRWRSAVGLPAEAEARETRGRSKKRLWRVAARLPPAVRQTRTPGVQRARPGPLGCVQWSSACRLPPSSPRRQSLSRTPWDWTRYTTSGVAFDQAGAGSN